MFISHGSPMNAIEENIFVDKFRSISSQFDRPKAILCVSAHWETKGTKVTAMENPKTIHDFSGLPPELYKVQYPAPGSPQLAEDIRKIIPNIEEDFAWGLDHGAWSILRHLYPKADIPIV